MFPLDDHSLRKQELRRDLDGNLRSEVIHYDILAKTKKEDKNCKCRAVFMTELGSSQDTENMLV